MVKRIQKRDFTKYSRISVDGTVISQLIELGWVEYQALLELS